MDKLFETVLKNVPSDLIPAILALVIAFFGVYYFKGLRNYTDAINDKAFLTIGVLICAAFILHVIYKPSRTETAQDARPLLLVPNFEEDERGRFKSLFIQQIQAVVGKRNTDASIIPIDAYIVDRESARLTGKNRNATAVLYSPKVIRLEDKKTVLCFSLLILDPNANKTYPPLPAELEKDTLEEISTTLLGSLALGPAQNDPLVARIEALERKVSELATTIFKTTALVQTAPSNRTYGTKRAIIVGVNYESTKKIPPLAFADADARQMDKTLKLFGFETTLILNEAATRSDIRQAIDRALRASEPDDLLMIYYAGSSMRSVDLEAAPAGATSPKTLILNTFDLKFDKPFENWTLDSVVEQLRPADRIYRLVVIDGCHGTFGLPVPPQTSSDSAKADERTFQIVAGTQDNEYGLELPQIGGGLFTRVVTSKLEAAASNQQRISTNELLTVASPELARLSSGAQRPKLVTLAGREDLIFATARQDGPIKGPLPAR